MASTITASSTIAPHLLGKSEYQVRGPHTSPNGHDVVTTFNYYKDPGDGSPPEPNYVGRPETFERPTETQVSVVHDIRGAEGDYTLDTTGFQIYRHLSQETAFEDDTQIKRIYYPEIEELLKTA